MRAKRPVEVHGHRGARAARPENTLAAFEYAIDAGADYVELDVLVTRDDAVVVTHDPMLNPVIARGRGPGIVRELTLAEVREWDVGSLRHPRFPRQVAVPGARVPTLDEVLALGARGPVKFNIEVKSFPARPEYAPAPLPYARLVLDALLRHNLERRVIVQSFDFRILHAMRELAPGIPRAALVEHGREDFPSIAREAGAGIVAPQHVLVTPAQVEAAHRKGLRVIAWTPNSRGNWQRMMRAGVDGIITDDPAGLIEFLGQDLWP